MSPNTFSAANVAGGRGQWISAGKDDRGRIPAPTINDINPAWVMMVWPDDSAYVMRETDWSV